MVVVAVRVANWRLCSRFCLYRRLGARGNIVHTFEFWSGVSIGWIYSMG